MARDAQGRTASFVWNWLARCNNGGTGARLGAEPTTQLQVTVLGNPTRSDAVEVEVSGAAGEPIDLEVISESGLLIGQQRIESTEAERRQWVPVGRSAGLYILRVHTDRQVQTVKLVKE